MSIKSVDEYIGTFPEETQHLLLRFRKVVQETAPEAKGKISWGMPTYTLKGNLVHFAGHKKHIGFYPGEEAIVHFRGKLEDYKTSKGAIQFPINKPMPWDLIIEIIKYRVKEANHLNEK